MPSNIKKLYQRGSALVLFSVALPAFLVLSIGLIELGHIHLTRIELDTATESGALAGAAKLKQSEPFATIRDTARNVALANTISAGNLQISDIIVQTGHYTPGNPFEPGGSPENAVSVACGYSVSGKFTNFLGGITIANLNTTEVAYLDPSNNIRLADLTMP